MTILKKEDQPRRKREFDLTGPQGNAFFLLGMARSLAKQLERDGDAIEKEMKESDYEHLVQVFDREFGDFVDLIR